MIKGLVLEFVKGNPEPTVVFCGPDKGAAVALLEDAVRQGEGVRREYFANLRPLVTRFGTVKLDEADGVVVVSRRKHRKRDLIGE